jgi:hypothetical protein
MEHGTPGVVDMLPRLPVIGLLAQHIYNFNLTGLSNGKRAAKLSKTITKP